MKCNLWKPTNSSPDLKHFPFRWLLTKKNMKIVYLCVGKQQKKKYVIEAIIIILKWHFLYIIPTDSF